MKKRMMLVFVIQFIFLGLSMIVYPSQTNAQGTPVNVCNGFSGLTPGSSEWAACERTITEGYAECRRENEAGPDRDACREAVVSRFSEALTSSTPAVIPDAFTPTPCEPGGGGFLGIPTWYAYLDGETDSTGRCAPTIESTEDALPIGLALFEAALSIGGIVAVIMVFIGSFSFVLSQGEPDKAASARRTVINAAVGLIILIVSARIVSFIAGRIG